LKREKALEREITFCWK